MSAELLAPGLAIGAAFESAYPVAKGNYYDIEARALSCPPTIRPAQERIPHLISMRTTD